VKPAKPPLRGKRPKTVRPSGGLRAWRSDAGEEDKRRQDEARAGKDLAGLAARQLAVELIEAVLVGSRALDDALDTIDRDGRYRQLEPRDRGFARLIAATVLRRLGSLDAVLARFIERPIPVSQPRPRSILLAGAAQVLFIGTPVHAAINLAVEQCQRDKKAERYDKLANAVLRRVAAQGPAILDELDGPRIDIPDWLWSRWVAAHGEPVARRIAAASLAEAPLDLTAKADAATWAATLGSTLLSTGSIRLEQAGRVEELPGFKDGAWWVQDAAAALPARLLGPVANLEVADLCAAPGGKTAELAAAGARVTAVDQSPERLGRLAENMARLGLSDRVDCVAADLLAYQPGRTFDAVLLDAPCLATGTIRRHPDLLHLKRPGDLARITDLQRALLAKAADWVKPGGCLVYCVCSMEPEEGEHIVAAFLDAQPGFERKAISPGEIRGSVDWLTRSGDLRTLPFHEPAPGKPGMDGFYAARLVRAA
jgi:16S rRNA (cytosine967-C5)-methyltransferase